MGKTRRIILELDTPVFLKRKQGIFILKNLPILIENYEKMLTTSVN